MPAIGRGGAGNIHPPTTTDPAKGAPDLEANAASAEPYTDTAHNYEQREQAPYAHKGRGGAGNYYSPKELTQKGRFEGAGTSHVLGDGTPVVDASDRKSGGNAAAAAAVTAAAPTTTGAWRGRGGAGNFAYGVSETEEKAARQRKEDEKEKERVSQNVVKDVEEGLARPEKAKVHGAEES